MTYPSAEHIRHSPEVPPALGAALTPISTQVLVQSLPMNLFAVSRV